MKNFHRSIMLSLALAVTSVGAVDLQECSLIKASKGRLACYDNFVATSKSESAAKAAQEKNEAEAKSTQEKSEAEAKAAQEQAELTMRSNTLAEVERLKAKLVENFKDPSTVLFKDVVAYGVAKGKGRIAFLCGQVNGKNSYGAFVGFKRFFMIGDFGTIEDKSNRDVIDQMWPTSCVGVQVYPRSTQQ